MQRRAEDATPKKKVNPLRVKLKPWLETPDGKIPNTETSEGRAELFRKVNDMSINLKTRAQLIERFVNKALDAETRDEFKSNAEEVANNVRKLNSDDVRGLNEALTKAFDDYGKARKFVKDNEGKNAGYRSAGSVALSAYQRRHGIR